MGREILFLVLNTDLFARNFQLKNNFQLCKLNINMKLFFFFSLQLHFSVTSHLVFDCVKSVLFVYPTMASLFYYFLNVRRRNTLPNVFEMPSIYKGMQWKIDFAKEALKASSQILLKFNFVLKLVFLSYTTRASLKSAHMAEINSKKKKKFKNILCSSRKTPFPLTTH